MRFALLVICLTIVSGCDSARSRVGGFTSATLGAIPFTPKGGQPGPAVVGGATVTTLAAPEDPSTASSQLVERSDERSAVVSVPVERVTETTKPDGSVVKVTETLIPTPVTLSRSSQKATTQVGTSHFDNSKTVTAKLNSMKSVQFVGIILILGSVAVFHPVVFAIVKSRTLQAALAAAGLALVFLPSLIVGNESELLKYGFFVVGGLLVWYFIQRHGQLQGYVDANNDGIDDRKQ